MPSDLLSDLREGLQGEGRPGAQVTGASVCLTQGRVTARHLPTHLHRVLHFPAPSVTVRSLSLTAEGRPSADPNFVGKAGTVRKPPVTAEQPFPDGSNSAHSLRNTKRAD